MQVEKPKAEKGAKDAKDSKEKAVPEVNLSAIAEGETFEHSDKVCQKLSPMYVQPNGAMLLYCDLATGAANWLEPNTKVLPVKYKVVPVTGTEKEAPDKSKDKPV